MEILQYIAELVQSQREIGITGLGTIYKKKSPGRFDAATRSFLPPSYTIAFKEEIADQEGFSNHLASTENISIDSANNEIAEFVASVKQQLSQYGQADFKPLGTLKREEGQLVLDANQDYDPNLAFFGLSKVQGESINAEEQEVNEPEPINQVEEVTSAPEVTEEHQVLETPGQVEELAEQEEKEQEPISEFQEPEIVVQVDPAEEIIIIDNILEEENPGNETHEPQLMEVQQPVVENSINYTIQEQPEAKKPDSLLLKVVLSVLTLVVLGILAYLFYPKSPEPENKPAVVAIDSAKLRKDSLEKVAATRALQDSSALQDSLNTPKPLPAASAAQDTLAKVAADTATTYEIIGASVLNQKEADWFITQMKRNGIKAKVVKNIPGKRLKMSIATLHDEQTAKSERDRLEKKLDIKGIYIYRNKKE